MYYMLVLWNIEGISRPWTTREFNQRGFPPIRAIFHDIPFSDSVSFSSKHFSRASFSILFMFCARSFHHRVRRKRNSGILRRVNHTPTGWPFKSEQKVEVKNETDSIFDTTLYSHGYVRWQRGLKKVKTRRKRERGARVRGAAHSRRAASGIQPLFAGRSLTSRWTEPFHRAGGTNAERSRYTIALTLYILFIRLEMIVVFNI